MKKIIITIVNHCEECPHHYRDISTYIVCRKSGMVLDFKNLREEVIPDDCPLDDCED